MEMMYMITAAVVVVLVLVVGYMYVKAPPAPPSAPSDNGSGDGGGITTTLLGDKKIIITENNNLFVYYYQNFHEYSVRVPSGTYTPQQLMQTLTDLLNQNLRVPTDKWEVKFENDQFRLKTTGFKYQRYDRPNTIYAAMKLSAKNESWRNAETSAPF